MVGFGSCTSMVVANHKKAVRGKGGGGGGGQMEGAGGPRRHMLSRGLNQMKVQQDWISSTSLHTPSSVMCTTRHLGDSMLYDSIEAKETY